MPSVNKDEDKKSFIQRCISVVKKENPGMENDQAVAICFSKWEQYNKKKGSK